MHKVLCRLFGDLDEPDNVTITYGCMQATPIPSGYRNCSFVITRSSIFESDFARISVEVAAAGVLTG
jgi:hypothetical protein